MTGTQNFQVFDAANANMTADSDYSTDTARLNGAQEGIADPLSFNKAVHQATIMAAALAKYLANQGQSFDDTNLSNLIAAIAKGIISGSGISFADRVAHGLFSAADIGQITFCPSQPVPAAATYTAEGTGNLLGSYHYREVLISGYINADGTYFICGFSPAAQRSSYDVSPSSQQVSITNLSLGSTGCIGRAIYRSAANGAAGSEKFCGIIWDNTTATYTDNLIDSQLGLGMPAVQGAAIPVAVPTANTTGTKLDTTQIEKPSTDASFNKNWYWAGQAGAPPWVWGGSDGTNMYVYNPSNFNVNYANSAGDTASINSSLTVTNVEPSGTLAPGKLWGVY